MVSEKRNKKAMVTLEESIHEIASNYASRCDMSLSSYMRSLLIRDLADRGLLTDSDVLRIASGG